MHEQIPSIVCPATIMQSYLKQWYNYKKRNAFEFNIDNPCYPHVDAKFSKRIVWILYATRLRIIPWKKIQNLNNPQLFFAREKKYFLKDKWGKHSLHHSLHEDKSREWKISAHDPTMAILFLANKRKRWHSRVKTHSWIRVKYNHKY